MANKTIIVPTTGEDVKVAVLEEQMKNLVKSVDALTSKIDTLTTKVDDNYVKKEDFMPVKKEVDGLKLWQVRVIATASVLGSLLGFFMDYLFRYLVKGQ